MPVHFVIEKYMTAQGEGFVTARPPLDAERTNRVLKMLRATFGDHIEKAAQEYELPLVPTREYSVIGLPLSMLEKENVLLSDVANAMGQALANDRWGDTVTVERGVTHVGQGRLPFEIDSPTY